MKRVTIMIITITIALLVAVMQNACKKDIHPIVGASHPTVTTNSASSITATTAQSGGVVTSQGSSLVTALGVCWGTSPNPSLADTHTTDGSGIGPFTSNIAGLTKNTLYYVRAYATSSVGTAYGSEINFSTGALPEITTNPISSITISTALSGGDVISEGSSPVTARGVCWGTSPEPCLAGSHTSDGSGIGPFTSSITSLTFETQYYVRAYATTSLGTEYGNQLSFMTLDACNKDSIMFYSGQTYNIVAIGNQCWMAENLNIGIMVSGSSNQTNNNIIEKHCYNNDSDNCALYGGLYQWDEMMDYTTSPGNQGICPTGWHIPTDAEWCTLTTYHDATVNCNAWGRSGTNAGGKMKETGYNHWNPPNTGATNSWGFAAIGAGGRYGSGNFFKLRYTANIWSSTESFSTDGIYRYLYYDYAYVYRDYNNKANGFSVRCLKND